MLWGKWKDGHAPYPLVAHLLDAAAFAEILCDRWLPRRMLRSVAQRCQLSTDQIKAAIVTGAALHDVGKASPIFQCQLLASRPDKRFDEHRSILSDIDLHIPDVDSLARLNEIEKGWVRRHETVGAAMLHGSFTKAGAHDVVGLIAGHHGRWAIPDADPDATKSAFADVRQFLLDDPAWTRERERLIGVLAAAVERFERHVAIPTAAIPLLTGVVVLADWLASDLADRDPTFDGRAEPHYRRRLVDADTSVEELLGTVDLPSRTFADIFPFEPTMPAQEALVAPGGPGLRIVAVPTGDGKTEAALGHWLTNADERQGLFFALPTMTTADAMFARVRKVFSGGRTFGALTHGRAMLHDFYDLTDRVRLAGEFHDESDGLIPSRWLVGTRRALLAPVAVGTADQVLLSVVQHRFNFLRLLGVATKTVVFDEVHSYDAFMSGLLERFLAWAGFFNMDVVLLSATLPRETLNAYVSAYHGAAWAEPVAYPYVVTVQAGRDPATQPVGVSVLADREVGLEYHRAPIDDPVTTLVQVVRDLREAHPDAKIGVIVNQVRRCQRIAAELDGRGGAERIAGDLHVMHARFTAQTRADMVTSMVERYGKTSTHGAATLIATQLVEQSVDLDFDVLVTDLCPAPSLVQRIGRLHRHDLSDPNRNRQRPPGCTDPVVHIVVPAGVDDTDVRLWPWLPYPPGAVLRTWRAGLGGGTRPRLRVPDEVQAFIDGSHLALDELFGDVADAAVEDDLLDRLVKQREARNHAVPLPTDLSGRRAHRALRNFSTMRDEAVLATRWIEDPTVDVLAIGEGGLDPSVPLPRTPSKHDVHEILANTLSLPYRSLPRAADVSLARRQSSWKGTALESVVPFRLTATARLDPLLGFITQPEDHDGFR